MRKFTFLVLGLVAALSASAIDNVYLIGAATPAGWDPASAVEMTAEGNDVFTYTGDFTSGEFKFTCAQGEWFPRIVAAEAGVIAEAGKSYDVLYGENDTDPDAPADYKFYIAKGNYTLTLTMTGETGTLAIEGTAEPEYPEGTPMICGSFNGWGAPEEMTDEGGNIFSYEGAFVADDNFKFRWEADWWPAIVAEDPLGDVPMREGEAAKAIFIPTTFDARDHKFFFEDEGEHKIFLDMNKMIVYIDQEPTADETPSEEQGFKNRVILTNAGYAIETVDSIISFGGAVISVK